MPNWCECDLLVDGPADAIRAFKTTVARDTEALSTDKLIPYPVRFEKKDDAAAKWEKDHLADPKTDWSKRPKDGFNNGGYDWCIKNWGAKWGEIDLICTKNNVLVFVEVKLKMGDRFGSPEEMVNKRKLGQIMRMAEVYESKLVQKRIDVVAIVMDETTKEVERISHYEGVSDL